MSADITNDGIIEPVSLKAKREPIYFNLTGNWYKGNIPAFYDVSKLASAKILEENYEKIKAEILSFYKADFSRFEPMYVPHDYVNTHWVVFNFYGFLLRYPENLKKFPELNRMLNEIPGMVGAQISVLEPHSKIKAHISGSNALIRNHLAIIVPAPYPEIGIRVKQEERGWEEGKVLAFTESHRHWAWNHSDQTRIVLLVDVIHPDYYDKKYYICAASLSVILMKMFAVKFPSTKELPKSIIYFFHKVFMIPFYVIFFFQDYFNINLASALQKLKFKK